MTIHPGAQLSEPGVSREGPKPVPPTRIVSTISQGDRTRLSGALSQRRLAVRVSRLSGRWGVVGHDHILGLILSAHPIFEGCQVSPKTICVDECLHLSRRSYTPPNERGGGVSKFDRQLLQDSTILDSIAVETVRGRRPITFRALGVGSEAFVRGPALDILEFVRIER